MCLAVTLATVLALLAISYVTRRPSDQNPWPLLHMNNFGAWRGTTSNWTDVLLGLAAVVLLACFMLRWWLDNSNLND